jgi:hypothetical protein
VDINFYKYKRNVDFNHDVKLLDGGDFVKSSASVVETDSETGEQATIDLAERQDEKVNLLYDIDVTVGDITNQSDFSDSEKEQVYRRAGRKVLTHIESVDYGDTSDAPKLAIDKNIGIDGTAPDFTNIALKPAHEYIGEEIVEINNTTINQMYVLPTLIQPYRVFVVTDDPVGIDHMQSDYKGVDATITFSDCSDSNLNGDFILNQANPSSVVYEIISLPLFNYVKLNGTRLGVSTRIQLEMDVTGTVDRVKREYGNRGPIVDREWFATAGIWSNGDYDLTLDEDKASSDSKASNAISRKAFDRRIESLTETLKVKGIDVVVTKFTEKFVELSEDNIPSGDVDNLAPYYKVEDEVYYEDIHYSYLTRYQSSDSDVFKNLARFSGFPLFRNPLVKRSHFSDSINASVDFLERMNARDELLPIPSEDISPFNSSIKEVVMAIVGNSEELYAELQEIYDDAEGSFVNSLSSLSSFGFAFSGSGIDRNKTPTENYEELTDAVSQLTDAVSTFSTYGILSGNSVGSAANKLAKFIKKALWFEKYAGEYILPDGRSVDHDRTGVPIAHNHRRLARLLVPIDMGFKTVRKKIPGVFGSITVTTKKDMGVRWAEVSFINADVYRQYRQSDIVSGVEHNGLSLRIDDISSTFTGVANDNLVTLTLSEPQYIAEPGSKIVLEIYDGAGDSGFGRIWKDVTVVDSTKVQFDVPWYLSLFTATADLDESNLTIIRVITPYPPTEPSGDLTPVQVEYNMPHLPFNDEIRNNAFMSYGPFDQSENAVRWSEFKRHSETNPDPTTRTSIAEYVRIFENQATNAAIPGHEVFHETSKSIADMRHGIDVHGKAQFLLEILKNEFGASRVKLTETTRSLTDQDVLQLGGPSSNFLSWHNYGLAVKIIITTNDGRTPIKDGTDDVFKLLNIAEAFVAGNAAGQFGEPCNVVWCGQLVTGPDLFVWEFLPIGVDHQDSKYFRDAAYNQLDPIVARSYVNATDKGYLVDSLPNSRIDVPSTWLELEPEINILISSVESMDSPSSELLDLVDEYELQHAMMGTNALPDSKELREYRRIYRSLASLLRNRVPYVLKTSPFVANGVTINDESWVSPMGINNFQLEKGLVLKDIQEFLFMVRRKFDANGSSLITDQSVMAWKMGNPISYNQLLLFNALIGSFDVCRALLASDYVAKYESLVARADQDPIGFVKKFLGLREYYDVKVYNQGSSADGAFITLHDGKLSVPILECRSNHPHAHGNLYGEKQLDFDHVEFGQIKDGVFTPEFNDDGTKNEFVYIKSDEPILSGYDSNGKIIPVEGTIELNGDEKDAGDALWLHMMIKDKLVEEYNTIKSSFENLKTNFLHDNIEDSPNGEDLLENEFGIISTQTLMTFDQLRDMYRGILINNGAGSDDGYGNKRGVGQNIDDVAGDGLSSLDKALTLGGEDRNRDQSVYEKLVSTAQLTGIQFSRLSKEKPEIEPLVVNKLEDVIKKLQGNDSPDVRDIL